MSCLLSLTPCHPDDVLGMHITPDASGASEPPGRLPPVPGSHGKIQVAQPFPEKSRILAFAFHLTVLNVRGPHCSSEIRAKTRNTAIEREQFRYVLWYARYPCLLWQDSASRSPTLLHRESRGH